MNRKATTGSLSYHIRQVTKAEPDFSDGDTLDDASSDENEDVKPKARACARKRAKEP